MREARHEKDFCRTLRCGFAVRRGSGMVAPAVRRSTPPPKTLPADQDATLVQRGAYLARRRQLRPMPHRARWCSATAGGDGLQTPFGACNPGNLTPHPTAGIGQWSEAISACHAPGVGPDGRVLNPAFPYTSFTRVSRADSDALFAYLRAPACILTRRTSRTRYLGHSAPRPHSPHGASCTSVKRKQQP